MRLHLTAALLAALFLQTNSAAAQPRDPQPIDHEIHRQEFNNDARRAVISYRVIGTLETIQSGKRPRGLRFSDTRACRIAATGMHFVRTIEYSEPGGPSRVIARSVSAISGAEESQQHHCNRMVEGGAAARVHRSTIGTRQMWQGAIDNDLPEVRRALKLINITI